MATVQVHTAERTAEIEANTIVSGSIDGSGHLILTKNDASTVDAGSVVGSIANATDTDAGVVELATDAETIAGTDTTRAVTPLALAAVTSTESRRGLVELASNAETIAGTDAVRAVTPAGLAAKTATTDAAGIVELATAAEVLTGTDTTRAVTVSGLVGRTSTETQTGIIRVATAAEVTTGTADDRAVTPLKLATALSGRQAADTDLTAIASLAPTNDDVIQRKAGVWTNRTMSQLGADISATGVVPNIFMHNGTTYVDTNSTDIYIGSVDPGSVANGSVWFDTSA